MGIDGMAAQMILFEHNFRPIKGTILIIGRHSIGLTEDEMDATLIEVGVEKRKGFAYAIDCQTIGVSREKRYITQESFFGAFTDSNVLSLNISDYEGADIVVDLQGSIGPEHICIADFTYKGNCLDNIFDPAAAIQKHLSPTETRRSRLSL